MKRVRRRLETLKVTQLEAQNEPRIGLKQGKLVNRSKPKQVKDKEMSLEVLSQEE